MEQALEQVHLQITRNCNLRCWFCGQWGRHGFFSDAAGREMQLENWMKVIDELVEYRALSGISPFVMVWGGEPLVSPYFDTIVETLHEKEFRVGMVTNGVLIDRHAETIDRTVNQLFLSLDGPREIHDAIRGPGVFETVLSNIVLLKKPRITVMSVVTPALLPVLPEFLEILNGTNIHELLLQDMIGLTSDEVRAYKEMMMTHFGQDARNIESWENNGQLHFHEEVDAILAGYALSTLGYDLVTKRHNLPGNPHCLSPFRHAHVTWNGDVTYCTDFYDFRAGNVKDTSLLAIFGNERSDAWRGLIAEGGCPTCRHCSWKNNTNYRG